MDYSNKTDETQKSLVVYENATRQLYHEDNLLAQRTYNFLTASVFLSAIVAIFLTRFDATVTKGVAGAIAVFGTFLSLLQIALGRRCHVAILFWRTYARLLELRFSIPVDYLLFEFYEKGSVTTQWGRIVAKPAAGYPMYSRFPWTLVPSTNILVRISGSGLVFRH